MHSRFSVPGAARMPAAMSGLVLAAAVAATAFASAGPASASAAGARPAPVRASSTALTPHQVCFNDNPGILCLHDPSDGGAGTPVDVQPLGGDRSKNWNFFQDTDACNHTGKVEAGCGLPDFLVDRYLNDKIVFFKQEVSGDCLKFSADTHWLATMGTCLDNTTLFIWGNEAATGYFFFPSIEASEFFGTTQWLCGVESGQPYAGTGCGNGSTWGFFTAN